MKIEAFTIALISDLWTRRTKEDYLSIVVHYIDSSWNLQKRIIGFRLVDTYHIARVISERVLSILSDYELENHIKSKIMQKQTKFD